MKFSEKDQIRIWNEAQNSAGPRYTKDINVELPIKQIFDGIGRTDSVFDEIEKLKAKVLETYKSVSYKKVDDYIEPEIRKNLSKTFEYGELFNKIIATFGVDKSKNLDLKDLTKQAENIQKYTSKIESIIWDVENKEELEDRKKTEEAGKEYFGHSASEYLRKLQDLRHNLREFDNSLRDIAYFSRGQKAKLINDPFMLVLGSAGMGKTHLVCDITKERIDNKLPPTIIVLGEKLIEINDPLRSILKATSLKMSPDVLLKQLNTVGKKNLKRSLLIVDAINETDKRGWKKGVRDLIKKIKKYPWVGLVMTCRTPFEFMSLPKKFRIITVYHEGFLENELEAMTAFFSFYKIPLPEVPLLITEFGNPLFLSCFCKTANSIKDGRAKVAKQIRDLALGQVGMTKILEDFYITKEKMILDKYGKPYSLLVKKFWLWGGDKCFIKRVAKTMSANGRQYLSKDEIVKILLEMSDGKYNFKKCTDILTILVDEGTIIRDLSWNDAKKQYLEVYKFSFNKFSDHIIARYLFESYFDSKNIKKSLSIKNPLSELISDPKKINENIDLIEALMVEFPERIKNNKALGEKDLIDFLPTTAQESMSVMKAFIGSLYWRKPSNFLNNKSLVKKSIVNYINKKLLRYVDTSNELLDLFVSTGTKPFHPLNAKRFSRYLTGFTMQSRDLFWSEYLRKQYGSGSVYRLISWIENKQLDKIAGEQAAAVTTILAWVLTTNIRLLRTRAIRCITMVGKIQPKESFNAILDLLDSNDPYVTEGLLCASYGIGMILNCNHNKTAIKEFAEFAKQIYKLFFQGDAPLSTTHVISRDYAKNIILLALRNNKKLIKSSQVKKVLSPYSSGGIRRWGRCKDNDEGKYRNGNAPLGMDFENYTLGRLIKGRRNYDYENKDFIRIKENVLWRIYQLGYSLDKFGQIDSEIASSTRIDRGDNYAGKIDRYGKKYCWIAYFELFGYRCDKLLLDDWQLSKNGRLEDPDIDPYFPESNISKSVPIIKEDLAGGPKDIEKWLIEKRTPDFSKYKRIDEIDKVKGPWILVHGSVDKNSYSIGRRETSFITGVLIDKDKSKDLEEFLAKTDFPGDRKIPEPFETRGVFSGELGWNDSTDYYNKGVLTIDIPVGQKVVKLTRKEKQLYGVRITFFGTDGKQIDSQNKEDIKIPETKIITIYKKIPVKLLARWFSSKDSSQLGKDDDGLGIYIPSQAIMKKYNLIMSQDFQICNSKGETVSICHINGKVYDNHECLLYMRTDLIQKIEKLYKKKLFLIIWGERQNWTESGHVRNTDLDKIYQSYKNIHKKILSF